MSADKFLWHMEKGHRDRVIERIEEEKKNEPPTTIKAAHEKFLGQRGCKGRGKGSGRFGRST